MAKTVIVTADSNTEQTQRQERGHFKDRKTKTKKRPAVKKRRN